jgi:hypothetical protein
MTIASGDVSNAHVDTGNSNWSRLRDGLAGPEL